MRLRRETYAVPPIRFRLIQRGIRTPDKRTYIRHPVPQHSHTATHGNRHGRPIPANGGVCQPTPHAVCELHGLCGRYIWDRHQKFIAPVPAAHGGLSYRLMELGPHHGKHRIPAEMSIVIVHPLEVIQVKHEERECAARLVRLLQCDRQPLHALGPVETAGQPVMNDVVV